MPPGSKVPPVHRRQAGVASTTGTTFPPDRDFLPIDGTHTCTVTRVRVRYRWNRPTILAGLFLMEIGDFFVMRRMLPGIRDVAEATREERALAGSA